MPKPSVLGGSLEAAVLARLGDLLAPALRNEALEACRGAVNSAAAARATYRATSKVL